MTLAEVLKNVEDFHDAFDVENGKKPRLVGEDVFLLRHRLMDEENEEYLTACKQDNLVEIADSLGDQLYILCGTILKHGMQHVIEDVFKEIQSSNMSKLDVNKEPIYRRDGKILKGPNYFKPNIKGVLDQQTKD